VREQWVGLISQVSKCVINRYILDLESCTGTWLVYPHFFLVQCVSIGKGTLEIIDTCPQEKHIIEIGFHTELGICAYLGRAKDGIALAIKGEINICLRKY